MIELSTLSAMGPKDGQKLSRFLLGTQERESSETPILQLLLGQLASLEQKVNALALSQAGSHQSMRKRDEARRPAETRQVDPKKMTRVFD